MKPQTRIHFGAYCTALATLNGVQSVAGSFTVAPTVAQTMLDRIRESADFLQQINYHPVDEKSGEKLFLDIARPIAGLVDTRTHERDPEEVDSLDNDGYDCHETQFDASLSYAKLDQWAKFPDFQLRVRNGINAQIARDQLMIGFNGTSRARPTDRLANPLLQDVNVGWLEKIRQKAPQRCVPTGLKVGDQADAAFRTLDAAVKSLVSTCIEPWHRTSDLVVVCGQDLIDDKYLALTERAKDPTEINALNSLELTRLIGGYKAIAVPYFNPRKILVTRLSNLSLYVQSTSLRRFVVEQPARSRVAFFNSMNTDYVVEDFGAAALIDGVLVPDGQGGWH